MSSNRHTFRPSFIVILAGLIAMTASVCAATVSFTDIGGGLPNLFEGATVWGDYDSDGDLDLLLSGRSDTGEITRIYKYLSGAFTESGTNLPGVRFCSAAWGDYDNDGDLDLLLLGRDSTNQDMTKVFRNDGALGFTDVAAGLAGLAGGAATWADYDNDGDPDILICGQNDAGTPATLLYRNEGSGGFVAVAAGFVHLDGSSAAWGDYDNDGDLDLVLAGFQNPGFVMTTRIYKNEGDGAFVDIAAGIAGAGWGSVGWADYDCDGDLDLLVTGSSSLTERMSRVYRNDGADVFTDTAAGLVGLVNSAAAWGDYDNDGDPDILMGGEDAAWNPLTLLYRNNGAGSFVQVATTLHQLGEGTAAWGDYDNDGDLDIVESGRGEFSQIRTAVFRSDGATPNTSPSAPTNLASTIQGDRVLLSWSAATDAQTPAACLTYNLRVGTSAGGSQIMSAMARSNGHRHVVELGNAQKRTSWAIDVRAQRYYWSVQAIDGALAGSSFAAEQTIPLSAVEGAESAARARIHSIVPNPSSRTTDVTVELGAATRVKLAVYDVSGRCIRVLLEESMAPGTHRVSWDGKNDQGLPIGAGFYLCRLEADSFTSSRSILRID